MEPLGDLRIAVLGAGAVGSFYGGLFSRAGLDVTLVARGRHLEALRNRGLVIDSFSLGRLEVPVKAEERLQGNFDVIIVAVKVHDTAKACVEAREHLREDGFVVSFQNGIENVDLAAASFGPERTLAASLFVALRVAPPGTVRHTAAGRISFGAMSPAGCRHEGRLAALCEAAGLEYLVSPDIRLVLWKKLLWNVAFNPLSALLESTCGRLAADPGMRSLMEDMVEEGVAAAAADGVSVPEQYWRNVVDMTENLTEYKTSMYQDVEKHRPLEVDGILGPVIRKLAAVGKRAPHCATVLRQLRFKYGGHYLYTPRLAADVLVLNGDSVLLIERRNPPHGWAIPGGFVDYGEPVEQAAARELREETGIAVNPADLELLGVYSDPSRDPRGHVAAAVYVIRNGAEPRAGDDAARAAYFPLAALPSPIAFDHAGVIEDMKRRYRILS